MACVGRAAVHAIAQTKNPKCALAPPALPPLPSPLSACCRPRQPCLVSSAQPVHALIVPPPPRVALRGVASRAGGYRRVSCRRPQVGVGGGGFLMGRGDVTALQPTATVLRLRCN